MAKLHSPRTFGNLALLVFAAAKAIRSSGVRPERTIRFVLFTGEEQGLLGSRAYVQQHVAEMRNLTCALVMDWGAGAIVKFPLAGHPELQQPFQELFKAAKELQSVSTSSGFLTFTEAFSFTLAGVPGIAFQQDSPGYDRTAHSTDDALERVDHDALRFNTKVLALSAVWLADFPERPGIFFSPAQTQQAISPLRSMLQVLNLWR